MKIQSVFVLTTSLLFGHALASNIDAVNNESIIEHSSASSDSDSSGSFQCDSSSHSSGSSSSIISRSSSHSSLSDSSSSSYSSSSSSSSSDESELEDLRVNTCVNSNAFTVVFKDFSHYDKVVSDTKSPVTFAATMREIKENPVKVSKIKESEGQKTLILRCLEHELRAFKKYGNTEKAENAVKALVEKYKKKTQMDLKYVLLGFPVTKEILKVFKKFNVVVVFQRIKLTSIEEMKYNQFKGIVLADFDFYDENGINDFKQTHLAAAVSFSECIPPLSSPPEIEEKPKIKSIDSCFSSSGFTLLFKGMASYNVLKHGYHPDAAILVTRIEMNYFPEIFDELVQDEKKMVLLIEKADLKDLVNSPNIDKAVNEILNFGSASFKYFAFEDDSLVTRKLSRAFSEQDAIEISEIRPWNPEELKGFVVVDLEEENISKTLMNLDIFLDEKELTPLAFEVCVDPQVTAEIHNLTEERKLSQWRKQLKSNARARRRLFVKIGVDRENIFEDSFEKFSLISEEMLAKRVLQIKFKNERDDYSFGISFGIIKDWYTELTKVAFNPQFGLFKASETNQNAFAPVIGDSENQLKFLRFIGRVIGMGLTDSLLLPCHFTKSFCKLILGKKPNFNDLAEFDAALHQSLTWIAENDVTKAMKGTTFTASFEGPSGEIRIVELKEGGAEIALTEENKFEYIRLMIEYKLEKVIQPQIDAFLDGFYQMVPVHLLSNFTVSEFSRLLSGEIEINVDDWEANTNYLGYNRESPQVIWFWQAVRSFTEEEKRLLLKFVTGSPSVPLGGFRNLFSHNEITLFDVQSSSQSIDSLPNSHTCYNEIHLPAYENYANLRAKLLLAIQEGNGAFFG